MSLASWILKLTCGAGAIGACVVSLLYVLQEKLLYVPVIPGGQKGYEFVPSQFKLKYKDLRLEAEDGTKLHGWQIYDRQWEESTLKSRPTILFFQANAGNISHRLNYFCEMINHLGCIVVAISYRGYGWSDGKPSEIGLKMDSEAVLQYVLGAQDLNSEEIYVFGRSLGGAVAIHLTAKHPEKIAGLIIENAFTSVEDMVPQVLPLLGGCIGRGKPGNFLVRNKWLNIEEIPKLDSTPILMFSSELDEMVPQIQMYKLRDACKSSYCNLISLHAHHMDAYSECPQEYWNSFSNFIKMPKEAIGRAGSSN